MTQEQLRIDLSTIENLARKPLTLFMNDVYHQLREIILKDLLELQIKEFDRN